MNHSVVGIEDGQWSVAVVCKCGKRFVASTEDQAMRDHAYHFGLSAARAALRGDTQEADA